MYWYPICIGMNMNYEYMAKLLKSNYRRALKFNGTFRKMDEILSSINSDGVFKEDISKICPSYLELTKENDEGNISADILDLTVELGAHSRKFSYKLYDKRDKHKFSIANCPDLGET